MSRGLAAALLVIATLGAGAGRAAAPVSEETVHAVAAQLRCVVCQSLSVADSPSETAGETPEQVKAYFVDKYGLWILLSPPRQGFNLLVWVVPFAALGVGLVFVLLTVRRWSRRPAAGSGAPHVNEAMRARISREMAEQDQAP
jgi:cytochrome c-type biogenesis protein CcmH